MIVPSKALLLLVVVASSSPSALFRPARGALAATATAEDGNSADAAVRPGLGKKNLRALTDNCDTLICPAVMLYCADLSVPQPIPCSCDKRCEDGSLATSSTTVSKRAPGFPCPNGESSRFPSSNIGTLTWTKAWHIYGKLAGSPGARVTIQVAGDGSGPLKLTDATCAKHPLENSVAQPGELLIVRGSEDGKPGAAYSILCPKTSSGDCRVFAGEPQCLTQTIEPDFGMSMVPVTSCCVNDTEAVLADFNNTAMCSDSNECFGNRCHGFSEDECGKGFTCPIRATEWTECDKAKYGCKGTLAEAWTPVPALIMVCANKLADGTYICGAETERCHEIYEEDSCSYRRPADGTDEITVDCGDGYTHCTDQCSNLILPVY